MYAAPLREERKAWGRAAGHSFIWRGERRRTAGCAGKGLYRSEDGVYG